MRKQLAQFIGKKVFTMFIAFVIISCSYAKGYAFTDSTSIAKFNAVTYQGLKEKSLVFNVDYKNELIQAFLLVIKGEHNEILYRKSFDAKPLNTNILMTEFPENCKLTFEIHTGEKYFTQTFQIDTHVKTIEEYVVKVL